MTDHRNNIFSSRSELEREIREALAATEGKPCTIDGEEYEEWDFTDWVNDRFLEIRVLREDRPGDCENGDVGHVDILLTFGGPNVYLHWDLRFGSTYFHSWGKDSDGKDLQTVDFSNEVLTDLVDRITY